MSPQLRAYLTAESAALSSRIRGDDAIDTLATQQAVDLWGGLSPADMAALDRQPTFANERQALDYTRAWLDREGT